MTVKMTSFEVNMPLNNNYEMGDKFLVLISYDNVFLI